MVVSLKKLDEQQSCLFFRKVNSYAKRLRKLKIFAAITVPHDSINIATEQGWPFDLNDQYDRIKCTMLSTEAAARRVVGYDAEVITYLAIARKPVRCKPGEVLQYDFRHIYLEIYHRELAATGYQRARCRAEELPFELSMAAELEIMNILLWEEGVEITHI
ncbi:hypothetical protein CR51_36025 [Caballeronia megalochromosomata]|nr:hypothetical protein CR51_36025 [Caballeronia megalochromosomata]